MGSHQRTKYTKKGYFGKRTGRHTDKNKSKRSIFGKEPAILSSPNAKNYRIKEVSSCGLRLRLCVDQSDEVVYGKQHLISDRHVFYVKNLSEDQGKVSLLLKRKKIDKLEGYRLIDLHNLNEHINTINSHVFNCSSAQFKIAAGQNSYQLLSESKRYGFSSILLGRCLGCLEVFYFHTSIKCDIGSERFHDINARAVWGAMATGGGCNSLNEQSASFDMPGISRPSFSKIEQAIGKTWEDCVHEEMIAAGCEERKLAMERGDFCDEIPAVTVVCDGGWSKRSHKHTYNALGGVGVILGAVTKKILYLGVRNKHCYICQRAENMQKEPRQHQCFRNWTESSQAMEADVIVEGFLKAEKMHGVRFMRMIGDGDSSVFARIQEEVPIWGSRVQKIECANHITKCLRTRLEELVVDNPHYKGRNNLTKLRRVRIVSSVRSAISYRSQNPSENKQDTVKSLQSDILNSIFHVFGIHDNCSSFCKRKRQKSSHADAQTSITCNITPEDKTTPDEEDFLQGVAECWMEGMSEKEQIDARSLGDEYIPIDPAMQYDVQIHLNRIAEKADKLIENATTNLAECWMGMRMKFDGGKVINRCNRGSWSFRCYGAVLRKNLGINWSPLTWEKVTGTRAGRAFADEYSKRSRNLEQAYRYQRKSPYKTRRWKRKIATAKGNLTKKAQMAYGPESLEVTSDFSPEQLEEKKTFFYEKEVNVSTAIIDHIEQQTQDQSLCGYWFNERKKRITASNFSIICKRRPNIPVLKLVQRLLYSTFKGTHLTRKGLRMEKHAICEYIQYKNERNEIVSVKKMGLFIDRDNPFLGASVDGIVEGESSEKGILEVKHVLLNNLMSFQEATKKSKSFCLSLCDGNLQLKENHAFNFQIQGQLNILKLPWADLVVRRVDPHQLHIQRIYCDNHLWNDVMLPKLKAFYFQALLPELAAPRHGKKPGIREPGTWYSTTSKQSKRSCIKKRKSTCPKSSSSSSDGSVSPYLDPDVPETATKKILFLGQHILHEWLDEFGRSEWYSGLVVDVTLGEDGDDDAEYEVVYDGFDCPYLVNHLLEDYMTESLKFI